MNTKKSKKAGFTLVELMVVAIIVAILAAVAIPLMSGNRERAIATEAQAGCSTVATAIKLYYVEKGDSANPSTLSDLSAVSSADLSGTYFNSYSFTAVAPTNYTVTATGFNDAAGKEVTMTVLNGAATFSGLDDVIAP
jgi:prepilin-type N-terminal cleavage/methylation domain-containing protein